MHIFHLDSTILGEWAFSRQLSANVAARQLTLHPNATVDYIDLAAAPPAYLDSRHLAVLNGETIGDPLVSADLAQGSAYIDALFAANIVIIGVPMYNFTVPAQLKSWIDRIAVAGRTFRYDENGAEGLLTGKKLFIASSRGGFYTDNAPMAVLEHHETYISGMLGFLGMSDITVVRAEGTNFGEDSKAAALARAIEEIAALPA